MASLQHHVATLLAFAMVAGCGGDRSKTASAADTTGAAAVTPDSAAMPAGTTATPAAADSTRSAAADTSAKKAAAATDTAAKAPKPTPLATKKLTPAKTKSAHATVPAPSGQATRDTTRVAKAESTNTAAAPAAAPTPQQQDTSKAATGAADQPLRDAYHQAPRDTVSATVYDGWKQFNLNCARCHGEDVLGTTIAPHLIMSLKPNGPINTKELFVQTVCAGRPQKGMPSWCALGLDMNKINDIYEYVKGRSDAKIGPGRPAVKQEG